LFPAFRPLVSKPQPQRNSFSIYLGRHLQQPFPVVGGKLKRENFMGKYDNNYDELSAKIISFCHPITRFIDFFRFKAAQPKKPKQTRFYFYLPLTSYDRRPAKPSAHTNRCDRVRQAEDYWHTNRSVLENVRQKDEA